MTPTPDDSANSTDSSKRARPTGRMHGLDALRGGALLLGILLHGLMPFVPGVQWVINDQDPRAYAMPIVSVIHLFRMTVFFLLAGFFGHLVVSKRGMVQYLKERSLRIGLPAFAFWPFSVMSLGLISGAWYMINEQALPPQANQGGFTLGQLWFLWVLLECCFILAGIRFVAHRLAPAAAARTGEVLGGLLSSPWAVLILAVPYVIAQNWQGTTFAGITEPKGLVPELDGLVAYFSAYAAGWFLWVRTGSLQSIAPRWITHLGIAVVGSFATLYLAGLLGAPAATGTWRYVLSVISAVTAWAWTYGLLGLCVAHLRQDRPWVRYLADASYWMYLLHLPLLAAIGGVLTSAPMPAEAKLVLTLGGTSLLLLLTYDAFVRSTWIGKWLNGHRRNRVIFSRKRAQKNIG